MSLFDWLRPKTELRVDQDFVRKLVELEARQTSVEKQLASIDAEWSEWFDKYRHMYARLAKRIKDAREVVGDGSESSQEPAGRTISPPPSPGHHQWIGGAPRDVVGGSPRRRNY